MHLFIYICFVTGPGHGVASYDTVNDNHEQETERLAVLIMELSIMTFLWMKMCHGY